MRRSHERGRKDPWWAAVRWRHPERAGARVVAEPRAVAASCPVSNVASYSGTVSLSYTGSVSNAPDGSGGTASESMDHSGEGLDTGPMTPDKADQDFTSTSLSGTSTSTTIYSDTNNGHTTTASLTGDNAPVLGQRRIDLVRLVVVRLLDLDQCRARPVPTRESSPTQASPTPRPARTCRSPQISTFRAASRSGLSGRPFDARGNRGRVLRASARSRRGRVRWPRLWASSGPNGDIGPAQLSWNFTPTFKTKVCDVPTVAGKSLSDAKTALTKANCADRHDHPADLDDRPQGRRHLHHPWRAPWIRPGRR